MSVISIQSQVAFGHVGNSAAVFPMQMHGIDVIAVPTTLLSNRPGYPTLRGRVLDAALVETPPLTAREGGMIRRGFDAALDELLAITRDGKQWMANFQAQEIVRTNITSLKVGYNQVFGYYIEVTHAHAGKVPADYQRKQTLKNA